MRARLGTMKPAKFFGFSIFLLVSSSWVQATDTYLLRIQAYQATISGDASSEHPASLLKASQEPRLTSLRELVATPDKEWSANIIKTLFDLADLEAVNELFTIARPWDGRSRDWLDRFLGAESVFRLETSAQKRSDEGLAFRVAVFRSKEGLIRRGESLEVNARKAIEAGANPKKMDQVVETEFMLDIADPVILCSPLKDGLLFVVISLALDHLGQRHEAPVETSAEEPEIVTAPRTLDTILPYYPESLQKRHITGRVGLLVAIDESGKVVGAKVIRPLHPYLDYSVVQTLLAAQFEPAVKDGKRIEAAFPYEYSFEPATTPNQKHRDGFRAQTPSASPELDDVLSRSAAYCQALARSMGQYVCEETISEIRYNPRPNAERVVDYVKTFRSSRSNRGGEQVMVGARLTIMDPRLTTMTRYLCDYQIVQDSGLIKERRMIIKRGGRKVPQGMVLEEKRYSLLPIMAAAKILSPARQGLFDFRLERAGKAEGRECDIVKALPENGNEEGVESAKIWIGKKDGRVLKCEIEGVPVEGFEDVLNDCVQLNIRPRFVITFEYGMDHGALALPTQTAVRVEYPVPGFLRSGEVEIKATITMKYSKYRYFDVLTGHDVTKSPQGGSR